MKQQESDDDVIEEDDEEDEFVEGDDSDEIPGESDEEDEEEFEGEGIDDEELEESGSMEEDMDVKKESKEDPFKAVEVNEEDIKGFVETREIVKKINKKSKVLMPEESEITFKNLHLSRPLLKALSEGGFVKPTPIQAQAIPALLKGRDISASATTGSGKTAAFVLPILERLIYRDSRRSATRVLVLTPTRELALQCQQVFHKLSKFTNGIEVTLITGGTSAKKQEVDLRQRPDVIVATPGRILDHLYNTKAFGLDEIEIVVIDEADRLMEFGFIEQVEQIIKSCPKERQTMLFSATMTSRISELGNIALKNPIRVDIDPLYHVAKTLTQEFVRVRSGKEKDLEGMLMSLCTRNFKTKTIIFCNHKRTAHRVKILFGFFGLKSVELHGDLNQEQRFEALDLFRNEQVDFLIASDVAARGLDIPGVETVINFELPTQIENYVHRVGRTARAGKNGIAVSFVTFSDRKLFKTIVKSTHNKLTQRLVPPKITQKWKERIEGIEEKIKEVLLIEKEDKSFKFAEMTARRAENMIKHHDEIMSRPKRVWIGEDQDDMKKAKFLKKRKYNNKPRK